MSKKLKEKMDDRPFGLDLRVATDEQIRDAVSVLSYEMAELQKRLIKGDDWQRVIQAHLFLDHVLTTMITEELRRPEHLDTERMVFAAKIDLCAAMGLIDDGTKGLLRRVNKMRNSIAHNLSFKITRADAKALYDMSEPIARQLIDEVRGKKRGSLLSHCLMVNVVWLDISRQRLAADRLFHKRKELRLYGAMLDAKSILDRVTGNA